MAKQQAWRNRITGHGEEKPDQLQQRGLDSDPTSFDFLVAGGAEANEVPEFVSLLPIAVECPRRNDVVNVQIAGALGGLLTHLAAAGVTVYRCSALAFPVGRILALATPAGTVGGIIGTLNVQSAALTRAVMVFVLAVYRRMNAVLFAAILTGGCYGACAVAKSGRTTKRAKDVGALLLEVLCGELFFTLFALEYYQRFAGAHSTGVLARAIHIISAKPVYPPSFDRDGLLAKCTNTRDRVIDTQGCGRLQMAFDKLMAATFDHSATTASA